MAGTGIEDVRRAAGASPSSVYHLFGGLEDVVLALLVRTFERLFAHLATRVTRTRSAKGAVTAIVEGHLEWVLANRREARFMYQAMSLELGSNVVAELQVAKASLLAPVVNHCQRFVHDGSLPTWSPLQLDVVLLGPTHEACRRFLAGADLEESWMCATLPRLAWKAIANER